MKFIIILLLLFSFKIQARDLGQTEITTDDGIEVFQNEKYYLLKKNVLITSDNFTLKADMVKAFFEKDLYDIIKIESEGNVRLESSKGIIAKGNKVYFSIKEEDIEIIGVNSSLIYQNIKMYSDEYVKVNNLEGVFNLKGKKSEFKTEDIQIFGEKIDGKFIKINEINEIENLYVEDNEISNIITKKMNMYSLKADYRKKDNVIELFEKVKIIRDSETITGDYAKIDTLNESYKISSSDNQKVKAIIVSSSDE